MPYRQKLISVASFPRPRLITSREVNEARRPHTCSRRCVFEEKNEKNKHEIPPHPPQNAFFLVLRTLYGHSTLQGHEKAIYLTCRVCNPQTSHAPPHRDFMGARTHASTSLLRMSAGVLCLASKDHWCCTMCALGT